MLAIVFPNMDTFEDDEGGFVGMVSTKAVVMEDVKTMAPKILKVKLRLMSSPNFDVPFILTSALKLVLDYVVNILVTVILTKL